MWFAESEIVLIVSQRFQCCMVELRYRTVCEQQSWSFNILVNPEVVGQDAVP